MILAIIIAFVLIATNAFYVAAEFGTVSVRHSRIRQMAEDGNWFARRLLPVLKDSRLLDSWVAACQIGITWSSLLLGAWAQANVTPRLIAPLQSMADLDNLAAFSVAATAVLISTTVLQVVFGELVPKSVALQFPTQTALYTLLPMEWSVRLYKPFLHILNGSGLWILRRFGFRAASHRHIHSPEELELLIAESRQGGMLDPDEHRRLHRAIRLASRPVRQLMVPRHQVAAINIASTEQELVEALRRHPFTRYPVYRESPDEIVGLLHTADLVLYFVHNGRMPRVFDIMRPLQRVAENDSAERLLGIFRDNRTYQAAVVGPYGVSGLVTVGDLLSELLGDFDRSANLGQPRPEILADGRVRLPGLLRLDEATPWLGVAIASAADTLGGALLQAFGRMPKAGDQISLQGVRVVVERVQRNTIVSVLAHPHPEVAKEEHG